MTTKVFNCPLCGMQSPTNKFGDILKHDVAQYHPYIPRVDSIVCAKSNPTPLRVEILSLKALWKLCLPKERP